jgi:hypothetical protein
MIKLASDAALRRRLGDTGRRTAIARFDRSRLGDEISSLYHRLVG